ncbi:DUF3846 domain-containing protein [Herbiconiux daphne]|uniref:DUF3846 domain-containing protein n=1 Tax=Herbiconiux daphne TaxID=2970914 RepID=A0ABT2H796_9MICO|nr:DUF3846 domain-containing protein [Herbiconiux daphne]MCS5735791.1 DUF3846 domain-containing protein [Herbiconiux daphne]
MTVTNTNTYRGILIGADQLQQVTVPAELTWRAIQQAIDARNFDVVRCRDGIDLYVDDEGAINGAPFNLPLTIIAHALGHPAALFGSALALTADDDGDTTGLSDAQAKVVTDAIEQTPSPEVVDAVVATLRVHPAFLPIIAMLRSL